MGSSSPNRGENKKYLKPPPRFDRFVFSPAFQDAGFLSPPGIVHVLGFGIPIKL